MGDRAPPSLPEGGTAKLHAREEDPAHRLFEPRAFVFVARRLHCLWWIERRRSKVDSISGRRHRCATRCLGWTTAFTLRAPERLAHTAEVSARGSDAPEF